MLTNGLYKKIIQVEYL